MSQTGVVGKPIPVTVVPIGGKDPSGNTQPVAVDADGKLEVTVSVTSSGAAIEDGADPTIKATVKDYTNSNPLAVITVDTDGNPTGGAAVSIADGADVAEGNTADAAATGDTAGTVNAHLRGLGKVAQPLDLDTGAGTALTGGAYLALPGNGGPVAGGTTTNPVNVALPAATVTTLTPPAAITGFALEAGHLATIDTSTAASAAVDGTTAGAKVVTDANGTLQQYLRGLVTFFANALGAGTAAAAHRTTLASDDPAVATLGATTGAAVITDANGTIQQYLRGIVKLAITAGGWLVTAKKDGYKNASWATGHAPAANTKATITQASAGGALKNVCTGFTVSLAGGATAPAAIQLSVALIDGASGGGTYLWGPTVIAIPAVAGAVAAFAFGQRWDVGTAATAMTLEFSVAGGANTIESVSMCGTTTL